MSASQSASPQGTLINGSLTVAKRRREIPLSRRPESRAGSSLHSRRPTPERSGSRFVFERNADETASRPVQHNTRSQTWFADQLGVNLIPQSKQQHSKVARNSKSDIASSAAVRIHRRRPTPRRTPRLLRQPESRKRFPVQQPAIPFLKIRQAHSQSLWTSDQRSPHQPQSTATAQPQLRPSLVILGEAVECHPRVVQRILNQARAARRKPPIAAISASRNASAIVRPGGIALAGTPRPSDARYCLSRSIAANSAAAACSRAFDSASRRYVNSRRASSRVIARRPMSSNVIEIPRLLRIGGPALSRHIQIQREHTQRDELRRSHGRVRSWDGFNGLAVEQTHTGFPDSVMLVLLARRAGRHMPRQERVKSAEPPSGSSLIETPREGCALGADVDPHSPSSFITPLPSEWRQSASAAATDAYEASPATDAAPTQPANPPVHTASSKAAAGQA